MKAHQHDAEALSPGQPTCAEALGRRRFRPFSGLTEVLLSRVAGLFGVVGIVAGVLLPPNGLGPSICGMQRTLNLPCPGCGLTRSVSSFFQGHFASSWHYHPLGWVFAMVMMALAVSLVLPGKWREKLVRRIKPHEMRFGWVFLIFCALLLLYGIFRIVMIKMGDPDYLWWSTSGRKLPPWVG